MKEIKFQFTIITDYNGITFPLQLGENRWRSYDEFWGSLETLRTKANIRNIDTDEVTLLDEMEEIQDKIEKEGYLIKHRLRK